mgnify:CR=1 FL=1
MNPNDMRIGIIGGGQLGKMLIQEAKKIDFTVCVLDPSSDSPAGKMADEHIIGSLYDEEKIIEIVKKCDVTTFEIEHINTDVLCKLEEEGYKIFPSPRILKIINNKYLQKQFLKNNGIPTADFERITDLNEAAQKFGFPFVQKSCLGGYDGRGVLVIKNEKDFSFIVFTSFACSCSS